MCNSSFILCFPSMWLMATGSSNVVVHVHVLHSACSPSTCLRTMTTEKSPNYTATSLASMIQQITHQSHCVPISMVTLWQYCISYTQWDLYKMYSPVSEKKNDTINYLKDKLRLFCLPWLNASLHMRYDIRQWGYLSTETESLWKVIYVSPLGLVCPKGHHYYINNQLFT